MKKVLTKNVKIQLKFMKTNGRLKKKKNNLAQFQKKKTKAKKEEVGKGKGMTSTFWKRREE